MTREEMTGARSLEFSRWVRENVDDSSSGICATDIDFAVECYRDRLNTRIRLIEIKTRQRVEFGCKVLPYGQAMTLENLNLLLLFGNSSDEVQRRCVRFAGLFIVWMDGTSPDDSEWIKVNGMQVDAKQFRDWMSFSSDAIEIEPVASLSQYVRSKSQWDR